MEKKAQREEEKGLLQHGQRFDIQQVDVAAAVAESKGIGMTTIRKFAKRFAYF